MKDKRFDLNTFQGRMNLFVLLATERFGKDLLSRFIEENERITDLKEGSEKMNFIFPQSLPELNLRLQILWGSLNQGIYTIKEECGKRLVVAVNALLDRYPTPTPVLAFSDGDEENLVPYRKSKSLVV